MGRGGGGAWATRPYVIFLFHRRKYPLEEVLFQGILVLLSNYKITFIPETFLCGFCSFAYLFV